METSTSKKDVKIGKDRHNKITQMEWNVPTYGKRKLKR